MNLRIFLGIKHHDYKNLLVATKNYNNYFTRNKHYDIAIVGGGIIGTTAACSLAKNTKLSEKSIVLFESAPQSPPKVSASDNYSNRVYSLTPGTKKFLDSLGVWNHIKDVRYKVVKKLQVWDACSDSLITFNDDLENDVSYIVENEVILSGLEKVCSEVKDNVTIMYNSKMKNLELPIENGPVKVEMENGEEFTCHLLIGADGVNSRTRQALGCKYLQWDHHQRGIVATLKLSEPFENIVAFQRFLPTGPIALLPLTDELSSLVWSTGTEEAEGLLKLSEESFVDAINDAFWKSYPKNSLVNSSTELLNKFLDVLMLVPNSVRQLPPSIRSVLPNSRASFPLRFGYSTKFVGPGVALVGDSAHRVHPLAGQGLNLGFKDVECLTEKLAEAVYEGKQIGSLSILSEYQSERQKHKIPMMFMIECLNELYSSSFTPKVIVRSLGLNFVNSFPSLKKCIIQQASL